MLANALKIRLCPPLHLYTRSEIMPTISLISRAGNVEVYTRAAGRLIFLIVD